MLDQTAQIYNYLSTDDGGTLFSFVGTRIKSPVADPSYDNTSAFIVFTIGPSRSHSSDASHTATVTFLCFGGSNSYTAARRIYRALHDRLHGRSSSTDSIISAFEVSGGQDRPDPDTGWPMHQTKYTITFDQD